MLSNTVRRIKIYTKYFVNSVKYRNKYNFKSNYTYSQTEKCSLKINNIEKWNKAFKKFIIFQPNEFEVIDAFYKANLKIEKTIDIDSEIILISVVKDELYRVQKFLEHYRKIGVHQFVIIDNQSTDGTKEYLMKQIDVYLISAEDKYTTNRREAWINRVLSYFGFDRWYMVADIDELIVYTGVESHLINELLHFAESRHITRLRGMMLDMYPEKYTDLDEIDDKYSFYKYFDSDTYTVNKACELEVVRGGFRNRCMGSNALLTKYPIFFFEEGDIEGKSHFLFPYYKNWGNCYLAIMHYKFLPSDLEKYRKIAEYGNYYNGSIQYKQYIKKIDDMDNQVELLYNVTVKYENSLSLNKIQIINKILWGDE